MSPALLLIIVLAALALGYHFYGKLIARRYQLDDAVPTPAHVHADGVDFVPTKPFYLMGQHFSAIAAAGPIVGPIIAAQTFGWLPCVIWIVLGTILIGAVHDFSALVASVRHDAKSIAEIVRENLSRHAWIAIMLFIWIALVYVIVAFTDVTAGTFLGRIEELDGVKVGFERGGAVAFAATAYLLLSIVMGLVQRKWNPPLWIITIIFVPATLFVVWLGTQCSTWLLLGGDNPRKLWGAIILGYCLVASLLPVWMLLQPRGYLGGFVLYIVLAVGIIGVLFGGHSIEMPAFKGFDTGGATGSLFPFLFVTIACGACSGFHGLVCSGTTSKQVEKESHCHAIGYGAMMLEGVVAVIALVTVIIVIPKAGTPPGAIYGQGIGQFLAMIIGKEHMMFAIVFGSMAFSTFVFDTLDVSTRLGRYILQELFGIPSRAGAVVATAITVGAPLFFILSAPTPQPGQPPAYMAFWTLFGTSNQLLAALTLLGVTVWLKRNGRPHWFTLYPMLFVMTITVWALGKQAATAFSNVSGGPATTAANGVVAVILIALAGLIIIEGARAALRPAEPQRAA